MSKPSRTLPVLLSLAAAMAVVPLTHAAAGGPTANVCALSAHVVLNPGISLTPSVGTIRTDEPGTLSCSGGLNGAMVTGPGPVTIRGTYGTGATLAVQGGDTCVQGSGSATVVADVPTTAGMQRITMYVETLALGSAGLAAGISPDGTRNGAVFQFSPDPGQDCTTVPVTGITVSAQAGNLNAAAGS